MMKIVPIEAIVVNRSDRQRRAIETADLEQSIAKVGLLQPLVVAPLPDGRFELIAGERRFTAVKALGWTEVPTMQLADLPYLQRQIIELEENAKRRDLTWRENVLAVAKIHKLHLDLEPDWTLGETADAIGVSTSQISVVLRVFADLDDPLVAECNSLREAYNVLTRRDERRKGDALAALLPSEELFDDTEIQEDEDEDFLSESEPIESKGQKTALPYDQVASNTPQTPPNTLETSRGRPGAVLPFKPPQGVKRGGFPDSILQTAFGDWLKRLKPNAKPFNLIHCDFPYGINLFAAPQGKAGEGSEAAYDDRPEVYFELLAQLCEALPRIMAPSGHLVFWFSEKHGVETRRIFAEKAPQLKFYPFPLIWVKTDNSGISGNYKEHPRHIYETAMFASTGNRPIIRIKGDAFGAPSDRTLHASHKPVEMLKHFFEMLVDEKTRLLDPTCGSGGALCAAEELKAEYVLGLEKDPQVAQRANNWLNAQRLARAKRLMEEGEGRSI